jgi:hypothetical protein
MKKIGSVFFMIALVVSCESEDNQITNYQISDGCYQGYFYYQDNSYWYSICFENEEYVEWPSGGAAFQKSLGCLTVGSYSTENNFLSFELDSNKFSDFPEPCVTDMYLPGTYTITSSEIQDSLIFERGTGDNQIIYYLKKPALD